MNDSTRPFCGSAADNETDFSEYPLVSGQKTHFRQDGLCGWCGERQAEEPNDFVVLSGGGLLMNREEDFGGPSDLIDGFLDLAWHEAHNPEPEEPSGGFILPIAQKVRGGQFGIFCCSVTCLRKLLNQWLDQMELMITGCKGA